LRILHVTSDWKWTGPAEPMLRLLLAQRARGLEAELACPEAPDAAAGGLAERARAEGVRPVLALERARGARPWRDRADARRLAALLSAGGFDLVHAWHTRDHVLAWRARRQAARGEPSGGRRRASAIVRSYARAERIPRWPWNRWLFGRASDGVLFPSRASAEANASLCRGRARGALGAVDLARFAPAPCPPEVRAAFGLAPDQRVVGIVARVQRHRRFDLLLSAAARLFAADPGARLLVLGRGTHLASVAREPAARLGIADRVVFAGHRDADYPDVLRAMDAFVFLVPGSDGSCRALLEAQACGLPAVTSRRGALPEIVADGETGLLVDEDPDALARALARLLADRERRARMGAAARLRAERLFRPERLADDALALYEEAKGPASPWSSSSSR
jgi:glycosyltransferase involved in cell wall biosynthesis